jgi:16S rRNA (adenine1518-N6/adenine1519-N6)-dimethyltransferase
MDLWQALTAFSLESILGKIAYALLPVLCITATSQLGILKRHGLRLKKSLGQHLLIDDNVARKLVTGLDLTGGEGVIEIGPGLGALTGLIAKSARRVVAVEIDGRMASILRAETESADNIEVTEANVLKVDLADLTRDHDDVSHWVVVGNLPYYITSAILMHLVEGRSSFREAFLTVQEEFAKRLVANPGSKDYSSLSIYVQYRFRPEMLFTIKPSSFFPRPEVRSAVVRLKAHERQSLGVRDEGLFFQTVRAAFGQRRKTLRRSLRQIPGITPQMMDVLDRTSGVGLGSRPEDVSIEDFAALSNAIKDVVG